MPEELGEPSLVGLRGTIATVEMLADTTYTAKATFELDVADAEAELRKTGPDTSDRECFQAQPPALVFDASAEPRSARIVAIDGSTREVALSEEDEMVPSDARFGGLFCFSAGSILLTVGTPPPDQEPDTVTLSPIVVFDLSQDGRVLLERNGTPSSLVADGGLVALVEDDHMTVWTSDGAWSGPSRRHPARSPARRAPGSRFFETRTDESGDGDVIASVRTMAVG